MELTITVPDHLFGDRPPEEIARRIRLCAALWMFRSGEISAGAACELAAVDRMAFAAECARHGIPLVDYPLDELRAEVDALRKSR